jgi:hypothetical protein
VGFPARTPRPAGAGPKRAAEPGLAHTVCSALRHRGTVCELVHGHGMRRCRYHDQAKAHLQHVFTAIAVNIERPSAGLLPDDDPSPSRPPTALQNYLDHRGIPRLRSWRAVSS